MKNELDKETAPPVAIVAIGALFPGPGGKQGFWRDIVNGVDNITDVPPSHWLIEDYYDPDPAAEDKTYAKRGGFISPVPFDSLAHGVPPNALKSTDTAQLLALIVAKQVLEEVSENQFSTVDKARISVMLGVASATELVGHLSARLQRPIWVKALREAGLPEAEVQDITQRIADHFVPWDEASFPGLLGNVVAGRIANRLDLGGSNFVTDAACASSLAAIQSGLNELYLGKSDLVIAGGVDALNDILMYMCFSKTPAFSPTGDCRPFSDQADGTIIGEGIGMFALRRLEDAEKDGDHIYGVIRGLGAASDGKATSVYAPRPEGQALAIRRAYDEAGYGPETVELVEAHGTGTIAGDAAEFKGLRSVFDGADATRTQWCALGSIKSQIGHTKAAAGAAGLFKAAMALHHKILPPSLKIDQPNPKLGIEDSPFYLNTTARPWIRDASHPRRAAVSSFGFGGSNFHLTVEEYTGDGNKPRRQRSSTTEIVLLSSRIPEELSNALDTLSAECSEAADIGEIANSCRQAFSSGHACRLAIVAASLGDLAAKISKAHAYVGRDDRAETPSPGGVYYGHDLGSDAKVAFLFPGQGSQYINMGADLAMEFDAARQVWDDAAISFSATSRPNALHSVVFAQPAFDPDVKQAQEQRLTEMANAQPAIAAVSLSQLAVLDRLGVKPDYAAGHSFGEVTALHAAGAFDRQTLLDVARTRGEMMTTAAAGSQGGMIAVAAGRADVLGVIESAGLDLVVANDNAPDQLILSGRVEEIDKAAVAFGEKKISVHRLSVASAFHSPIVAASKKPFAKHLDKTKIAKLQIPVYANATAKPYGKTAAAVRAQLSDQLVQPVRFRQTIDALYEQGVRVFVEVGPGNVLTGLVKKCLAARPHLAVALDQKNSNGVEAFLNAVGQLAAAGVALDLAALWQGFEENKEFMADAPDHAALIHGGNFDKPYPPKNGADGLPKPNPPRPEPAAPPALEMPVAATPPSAGNHLLESFHQQAAAAHMEFQKTMAESHQAFLRMMENALPGAGAAPQPYEPASDWPQPQTWSPPTFAAEPVQATAAPVSPATAPQVQPEPQAQLQPTAETVLPDVNVVDVLLSVVAEKTGYPTDMLNLEMELEAGLGIDSIKQVEIFSTLQDRIPALPEIEPGQIADMKTLGQIVSFVEANVTVGAAGPSSPLSTTPSTPVSDDADIDAKHVLLSVVAEKTGYPIDMLDLEMELEAGLGIDSIKQVEILSTLQDRIPSLPEIEPGQIAEMKTLGQIIAFTEANLNAGPIALSVAPSAEQLNLEQPRPDAVKKVGRHVVSALETLPSGFAMPGLRDAREIVVTGDGGPVGEALVTALRNKGLNAGFYAVVPADSDAVIFLALPAKPATVALSRDVHRDAFLAAKSVAPRFQDNGGVFVTVQDSGGDFGFVTDPGDRAWFAGLPGLVKTAALEWPGAHVKSIDVKRGKRNAKTTAGRIVAELLEGGPEIEVGLGDKSQRVTLATEMVSAEVDDEQALEAGSVIVVSGGARGVTAATVIELAATQSLKFVLLGRTELKDEALEYLNLPDAMALKQFLIEQGRLTSPAEIDRKINRVMAAREIRATLDDVKAAGSEAQYQAVDVQDVAAVKKCLSSVRKDWGRIAGVIHGAGVLADKQIADKTADQFDTVFKTKIAGLWSLLEATSKDPLQIICLFSSIAARNGNPGQCDYAMANEVLNKVAQAEARNRKSCVVRSINWGPWDGGMVTPSLKSHFEKLGVPLIPVDAGARFLCDELVGANSGDVEVIAGNAYLMPDRSWQMEVELSRESQPFVLSHVIQDKPVLPMVLVMEWFYRAAKALFPDLQCLALKDLQVLQSGLLEKFPDRPERFVISAKSVRTNGNAAIDLTLSAFDIDGGNVDKYRARMEMGMLNGTTDRVIAAPNGELNDWPWDKHEVYDGRLFHGPAFQVIHTLEGVSSEGGSAVLENVPDESWGDGVWQTNPATIDGGMQLVLLWGLHEAGQTFIPISLGSFVVYGPLPVDEQLRCQFTSKLVNHSRLVSDLVFTSLEGNVVAEIQGLDMYPITQSKNNPDQHIERGSGRGDAKGG